MENSDIMMLHGVGNQGGIRKSNVTRTFALIINHKVEKYDDSVDENNYEIEYEGAFMRGKLDQEIKYMNKALAETDWDLHVYKRRSDQRLLYDYIGAYMRVGFPIAQMKNNRRVYVYKLRRITPTITYDFDTFEY